MKIAIVTGCAGFIGINLTKRLLDKGWYVYGIDKLSYVSNQQAVFDLQGQYRKKFKFVNKAIEDIDWLPEASVLFNLAAESDVDNSSNNSATFIKSNLLGVQNLLSKINDRIAIKTYKPLFFHFSTDEVYGDITEGSFSEDSRLNPSNPYASTKAAADLFIKSWARVHGLSYVIVRPSNNYGKYQYPEKLIPLAVKNLTRGLRIKLHNQGSPIRTWTHVSDTIDAVLCILESNKFNRIYNISSNFEQTNIDTVTQIITNYFNNSVNVLDYLDLDYSRPGQDVRYSITCKPLEALGWTPKKDFSTELVKLVEFYKRDFKW